MGSEALLSFHSHTKSNRKVNDMNIKFDNYARHTGKRGNYNWYQWRLFVDEPDDVLKKIKNVEYLLHETFPTPLRISNERQSKFALESSGWGSFMVYITINFMDGTSQEQQYYLDLSKGWPN